MTKIVYASILLLLPSLLGCAEDAPCESNRARVAGSVTLNGKPVRGGWIGFVAADDPMRRVMTPIHADGSFRVADAPTGKVWASVDTEGCRISNPDNYVPSPRPTAIPPRPVYVLRLLRRTPAGRWTLPLN